MKYKKTALTFFSAFASLGFVGGAYVWTTNQVEPVKVYQFARDIPVNTKISANDLKEVSIPKKALTQGFVLQPKQIVGKYNSTKVFTDEYVIKSNLVKKEDVDPFESMDLTKMRKISLPVSLEDGLGGNLKRGDKVDLVFIGQGNKNNKSFNYSKTFMKDVMIYNATTAEGYQYKDKTEGSKNNSVANEDGSVKSQAPEDNGELAQVILAVTLEQAEQINVRLKTGKVKLIGRFDDSQSYDTTGYIQGDFEKVYAGEGEAETNK